MDVIFLHAQVSGMWVHASTADQSDGVPSTVVDMFVGMTEIWWSCRACSDCCHAQHLTLFLQLLSLTGIVKNSTSARIAFKCTVVAYRRSRWLGSRVVSVLDSGVEGSGFKSQPRRCRVTVLGKLFTPIVPLHQAAKLVAALLMVARVTACLAESNTVGGFMTHITCRLTAKNRDQLWNPTLGNRVWATFTFCCLLYLALHNAVCMLFSSDAFLFVTLVVFITNFTL